MQGLPEHGHEPVMVAEVLRYLDLGVLKQGAAVMDCTMGRGGHAVRIAAEMEKSAGGTLIGLDVDPENLKFARKWPEAEGFKRVELRTFHANFGEAPDVLEVLGLEGVDRLFADFGVSTNQLLEKKLWFEFQLGCRFGHAAGPQHWQECRRIWWLKWMRRKWRIFCTNTHRRDMPGASRGILFRPGWMNRYSRRDNWRGLYARLSLGNGPKLIPPPGLFRRYAWP